MAFTAIQRQNRLCLTKTKKEIVTKGRKFKNTQKILLDECYLLLKSIYKKKKYPFIAWRGRWALSQKPDIN